MRPLITSLFLLLASASLAGPIVPSRSFILAPKFRDVKDTTKGAKYLRQNGLWGNLARGYGSTDQRYAWSVSFGGIIQFAEWENSSLYLQGDADVLADIYNDISFNPRAIFWTEGIMYGIRFDTVSEVHFGYIHRCKHDIDNSGNNVIGPNEERTLIYGSLQNKFVLRDILKTNSIPLEKASLCVALDYYLVKQDYRFPDKYTDYGNSVEDLTFSLDMGWKIQHASIDDLLLYSRYAIKFSGYDWINNIEIDARAEIGIELKGEGTMMDMFVGVEALQDDMTRPSPVISRYWYLGVRFIGNSIGL